MVSFTIKTSEQLCIAKQRSEALTRLLRHQPPISPCNADQYPSVSKDLQESVQDEIDVLDASIESFEASTDLAPCGVTPACPIICPS